MKLFTYDINLNDLPDQVTFQDEMVEQDFPPKMKQRIMLDYRKKIQFFHHTTFE